MRFCEVNSLGSRPRAGNRQCRANLEVVWIQLKTGVSLDLADWV